MIFHNPSIVSVKKPNIFFFLCALAFCQLAVSHAVADMSEAVQKFKADYLAEHEGKPLSVDRLVTEPSGLTHQEMVSLIADEDLGPAGLQLISDFMKPEGSVYYDAIYGPFYGQKNIRAWLIPTMQDFAALKFILIGETVFIDDGEGGTSVDEWQMAADVDGAQVSLSRGISIRRFREGWITYGADIYDTGAFRQGPPEGAAAPADGSAAAAPALPPVPKMDLPTYDGPDTVGPLTDKAKAWIDARLAQRASGIASAEVTEPSGLSHRELFQILNHPVHGLDFDLMSDMMHPTDMAYVDPIFGTARGQADVREWLVDIMGKTGNIAFAPIGPILFDGTQSVQEFKQMAVTPEGERVLMLRGASIRRFKDGWLVYAADYFDTAPLADPEIQAASVAAGSRITLEDIMKYRGKHAL